MGFDLATASPVTEKGAGGFDLSTAKPVVDSSIPSPSPKSDYEKYQGHPGSVKPEDMPKMPRTAQESVMDMVQGGLEWAFPSEKIKVSTEKKLDQMSSSELEVYDKWYRKEKGIAPGVATKETDLIDTLKDRAAKKDGGVGRDYVGSTAAGAALNTAAPWLLQMSGRMAESLPSPALRSVGTGAKFLGETLGRQPAWSRAVEGGAMGALAEGGKATAEAMKAGPVVQGLAEFGAPMLVTPGKAAGKTLIGAKDEVKNISQEAFSNLAGRGLKTPLSKEGEAAAALTGIGDESVLDKIANWAKGIVEKKGASLKEEGEQSARDRFIQGVKQARTMKGREVGAGSALDQAREAQLGSQVSPTDTGQTARALGTKARNDAQQALTDGGKAEIRRIDQVAAQRAAVGDHIGGTPTGQSALEAIDAMRKPNAQGALDVTPFEESWIDKVYRSLVDKPGDASAGSPPPKPKMRSLIGDIVAHGGINPAEMRELGIGTKDLPGVVRNTGMHGDGLLEMAVQQGWITPQEVAQMGKTKPGGAIERVREMVRDVYAKEDVVHPADMEVYASWKHANWSDDLAKQMQADAATPRSFKAWHTVARNLREIQRGKNAGFTAEEGYKAGKMADHIEGALEKYLPEGEYKAWLKQYGSESGAISHFDTPLGKALTGTMKADPMHPHTDSSKIPKLMFSTPESVIEAKSLLKLPESDFEALALQHASQEMRDMKAGEARKFAKSEWMMELSEGAQNKIKQHAEDIALYENVVKKQGQGARRSALEQASAESKSLLSDAQKEGLGLSWSKEGKQELTDLIIGSAEAGSKGEAQRDAAISAIMKEPGGATRVQEAVGAILARAGKTKDGSYTAIDTKMVDKALHTMEKSGMYQSENLNNIRKLVDDYNSVLSNKTMTSSEVTQEVNEILGKKWGKYAFGGLILTGALSKLPFMPPGLASIGLEAAGAGFLSSIAYQRTKNKAVALTERMIRESSDPAFQAAMFAENNPKNAERLKFLIAKKMSVQSVVGGTASAGTNAVDDAISDRKHPVRKGVRKE